MSFLLVSWHRRSGVAASAGGVLDLETGGMASFFPQPEGAALDGDVHAVVGELEAAVERELVRPVRDQ